MSASPRRLAERRLLARRHDPRDERRVVLGLTATGTELDRPTSGTVEHAVERLLAELGRDEIATAGGVLTRVAVRLEEATAEEPIRAASRRTTRP